MDHRAVFALALTIFFASNTSSAQDTSSGVVSAARLETIWSELEDEIELRRHDKEALKLLAAYRRDRAS